MILRQGREADIGLLLEGTFPYVSGGVSSWVNQIIRGFPERRFALCFLGSRPEDYGPPRYALPDNVVHLEVHYLYGDREAPPVRPSAGPPGFLALVRRLHEALREGAPAGGTDPLAELLAAHGQGRCRAADFLHSHAAWDYLTEQYEARCTDPSFVDYFWTVRLMHLPLWQLLRIAEDFPPVRVYHTVSTGYAGFLGALLRQRRQRPLLVSEHGLYTKERKIDLFQAAWIRDNRGVLERDAGEVAYLRRLWVRFFEALGRECYRQARDIVALYEANRRRQIADGAPAARTRCIPNGIDVERLAAAHAARPGAVPETVCLIGRVVPIKDIKTYLRAMRLVLDRRPGVQAWIAGPDDEDPAYAAECRALRDELGLAGQVEFLGMQDVAALLPRVGVLALTSISEALPLVLLEGFAAGVPCVVTDVGACRELVEGRDAEDRALGSAGRVVGIANPAAFADAVLALLAAPDAWAAAQQAGLARVRRFYTQDAMFAQYRGLYTRALAEADAESTGAPPAPDRPETTPALAPAAVPLAAPLARTALPAAALAVAPPLEER